MRNDGDALLETAIDRHRRYVREPRSIRPILLGACHVRILVVTDGVGSFGEADLGLSTVLECLEQPAAPWVRFEVTTAHRQREATADLRSFRFDAKDLTGYDQLWLLGTAGAQTQALTDGEVAAVARFMDAGGGVLAAGDAGDHGSALCGRLPLVGELRVWDGRAGEPVPPGSTVVRVHPAGYAHPVLAGPSGPLTRLPDHGVGECRIPGAPPDAERAHAGPATEIVAWAGRAAGALGPDGPRYVGSVAVHDGHLGGAGRVVVEASWRRFVNVHLLGEAGHDLGPAGSASGREALADVVSYVRNVAAWLAPAAAQRAMWWRALWWARWHHRLAAQACGDPGDGADLAALLRTGAIAREVLGAACSPALTRQWVAAHLVGPVLAGPDDQASGVLGALDPWRAAPPASGADPVTAAAVSVHADLLVDAALGAAIAALARRYPRADADARRRGESADLAAEVGEDVQHVMMPLAGRLAGLLGVSR